MGVSVTFLASAEETGGELVETEVVVPAGSPGPPMHVHTTFEEVFTAVQGTLRLDHGVRRGVALEPGRSLVVARGTPHRYYNDGDEAVVFHFVARPGLAYERGIRASFGLAREGRTNAEGIPRNLFDLAQVFVLSDSYLARVPVWLQRGAASVVAGVGRLLRHDPASTADTLGSRSDEIRRTTRAGMPRESG